MEPPFSTWIANLHRLETTLRRLDLRLHTDVRLEPAPRAVDDQVHTVLWAKAELTSQGAPLLELEYSGCFRMRYQPATGPRRDDAALEALGPGLTTAPRVSLAQ